MSAAPWITTASGRRWVLESPTAEALHWPDVAAALAKICRFTGHTTVFYSVCEHCCRVADLLPPELRPHGLIHDAPEFVLNDLSSPLKRALRRGGGADVYDALTERHDRLLSTAAGIAYPWPADVAKAVKHADLVMLVTEMRDVMPPRPQGIDSVYQDLPPPDSKRIKPWPWPKAAEEWLSRLYDWCPATRTLGVD